MRLWSPSTTVHRAGMGRLKTSLPKRKKSEEKELEYFILGCFRKKEL